MNRPVLAGLLLFASASAAGFELDLAGGEGGPIQIEASESIEWRRNEKIYIAKGSVRAERGGLVLQAETVSAHYRSDGADGTEIFRLEAQGGVTVRSPDGTARGGEAVYSLDRSMIVMSGGGLELQTADYRLTARDSLEFHRDEGFAVARGAARAAGAKETLSADTLVMRFEDMDRGGLVARRLEAFGSVEVRAGSDSVTGERGLYDIEAQTAEVCGDVLVRQGPNRLAGECAQVDFATGRSRMVAGGGQRVSGLFEPDAAKLAPAQ